MSWKNSFVRTDDTNIGTEKSGYFDDKFFGNDSNG